MKTNPNDNSTALMNTRGALNIVGGLTKREHFAAMAMQGIISNGAEMRDENIAGAAVALADALIEALNKEI